MIQITTILCLLALLSGCASYDENFQAMEKEVHAVVDKMPAWASGKPPPDAPPKPSDPAYAAYKAKLEGKSPQIKETTDCPNAEHVSDSHAKPISPWDCLPRASK